MSDDATSTAPVQPRRKRWLRWTLATSAGAIIAMALGAAALVASQDRLQFGEARAVSTTVLDRNGRLLRAYAMENGRWRLPVKMTSTETLTTSGEQTATNSKTKTSSRGIDPRYVDLLLGFEDKRFREHRGVDPLALGRAAIQLATHDRIVSGGSTITMQLARLMEPRRERSLIVKLRQIVRALELERRLSKDEILDLYVTLAPFGGNLEGVRAASLAYFGHEPKRLTLGEAALLVALPQSPETRRLDRFAGRARIARDRVLDRMVAEGRVTREDAERAKLEAVPSVRQPMPILAPHATDRMVAGQADGALIRTTLDSTLQRALENLARDRAAMLGSDISIGIVAVDNASGDVLAHVGSPDYFDARRAGQVDMTRAIRSPGSTLKPFIYGMAFEDGFVHPESLIDDRPVRFGNYAPENFDMTFQGTVPVRKALQLSLNVPAIVLLDRVGASRLSARLKQAGGTLILPKDETPGLAMGLGGVGVTLTDLTSLYAGIARGGTTMRVRERMDETRGEGDGRRLLDSVAAWQVGNVLLGTPPPDNAVRNRIAFKTGTSYGYRDAWSVGFDGRMTVGVWVGRPDGAPVPGMLGRTAAAPVLFDAFARTGKLPAPLPAPPRGVLVAVNAKLPLPLKRFRGAGDLIRSGSEQAPHIQFPLNGSRIELGSDRDDRPTPLSLKVAGGVLPMTVLVNGVAAGEVDSRRQRLLDAPGPGFVRLTVMDATGAADTVVVRLQ